jgi:hypothetical protein
MIRPLNSITIAAMTVISSIVSWQIPVFSNDLVQPYDWTVEIQTQKLTRQFDYPGSVLQPIVKAEIQYYSTNAPANKTAYENIWFNNGKAVGLERLHNLDINQGDGVSLRIVGKTGALSPEECKAAANAILRMTLDTYLNRNAVVTVRLPDSYFTQIISALQSNPHIVNAPDGVEPADATLSMFFQSESTLQRQQLFYM